MNNLHNAYTIRCDAKCIDALVSIEKNTKGFLIVLNDLENVCGTLTDGDIRRALIRGANINDSIQLFYNRTFKSITFDNSLNDAIETFKNPQIDFLPILDRERKLQNIITKKQLHSLLLQNIHADLTYDFMSIDEGVIDHEIFPSPWGFYKTTIKNQDFQTKILSLLPKSSISLQSHCYREEHWIIVNGEGTVQLEESYISVRSGNCVFVPKTCKHRIQNDSETENLIVIEIQLGDYFEEDDIKRYSDIYNRV